MRHRSRGSPRPASVRRRSRGSPRPAPRPHPRCGPPPRRHARPGPPPGGALALAPPAEEGAPAPVPGGGHRGRPVAAADTAARAWNSPAAGQELAGGASARRGGRESSPPKPRRTRRPRRAGSLCSAGRALAGRHRALARGASPALADRHRCTRLRRCPRVVGRAVQNERRDLGLGASVGEVKVWVRNIFTVRYLKCEN